MSEVEEGRKFQFLRNGVLIHRIVDQGDQAPAKRFRAMNAKNIAFLLGVLLSYEG